MIIDDQELPIPDKLLLTLHNNCIVRPEIATSVEEISNLINLTLDNTLGILKNHEERGYLKSYIDQMGIKRYYLTSLGIIKVCSSFT